MSAIRRLLFVLVAVVFVALPGSARAEGAQPSQAAKDEAQDRFKRGIELYEEENFSAALTEFKRAYELVPAFQVLYNVARTCYQLRDYVCALRTFDRYLVEGGPQIDAKRKEEVERELTSMRRRVTTINVTATKGSTITVDGLPVGDAPLPTPLQVNEGRRLLRASVPGREAAERSLEVAGGTTLSVDLTLPEERGPVAAASSGRGVPWWLWGVTGALAVGAGVTGGLALAASGDASDIRNDGGTVAEYDSAESRMRTFTVATDVLAVAAIGAGVTALVLTLTSDHRASTTTGALVPSRGGGGLRLSF